MNKALKINFLLLRKQFFLYGFRKILIVFVLLITVLVGTKYLLFLVPQRSVLPLFLLIGNFIILLPLSDLSYVTMSVGHKKMLIYFKSVPLRDVQNYYLYRKFIAFTVVLLFLFFPLSVGTIPYSLFIFSLLGVYAAITTLAQRIFKNEQKTKQISGILKYIFIFSMLLVPRNFPDFAQQIAQIPIFYFVICIILFYTVSYANIKKNYAMQMTQMSKKVRYTYFKDLHILYILRTDMIAGLLTILVMSLIGFDRPLFNPLGFSLTLLTSYITIYQALLRNDQDKIQFFYQPNQLYKIRWNKLVPIIKFSVVYLFLAIALGLYTQKLFTYLLSYVVATAAFASTVIFIKINIEKGNQGKIVSWQDIVKIMGLSTVLVVALTTVL